MKSSKKKSESKEPERLIRGKKFQEEVRKRWPKGGEKFEICITKPSGRKGRIDVLVDAGEEHEKDLVAVAEIKASDWDSMTLKALRRNVSRQVSQIWDYIESQLEQGKHVSPGVIFPKRPKDPERLKLIEQLFNEHGIPVAWEDETIEERKARSQNKYKI